MLEGAYAGADAFFPSKEETEGIVVLEALAASEQVILRDIPVFPDWLTHGVNCWKGKDADEFRALVNAAVHHKLKDIRPQALQCAQEKSSPKSEKRSVVANEFMRSADVLLSQPHECSLSLSSGWSST